MTPDSNLPSDRDLVVAARHGSDDAWAELRRRHEGLVRRFGAAAGFDDRRADAAFDATRERLRSAPPDELAPGVRAIRPMLLGALTGGTYAPTSTPTDADAPVGALGRLAVAFGRMPGDWQAVLWHRYVDRAPAVEATMMLGRSTTGVLGLEQVAARGLFDLYNTVSLEGDPPPPPLCRPVIAALGAYRRSTLPASESRLVEAHLAGSAGGPAGCEACRERLKIADRLPELVPRAVVPGLTGLPPDDYRLAAGLAAATAGTSALAASRARRSDRRATLLAVAVVVVAVLAAAWLIRAPFGSLEPELTDLLERANASTTTTTVADPTATLPDRPAPGDGDANRIDLVFPDGPQGAVYVPGGRPVDLSIALSTPAPVFAGGTGTVDATLTNNDTVAADLRFYIQTSEGIVFDELTEGSGSCRREDDDGATCALRIPPGATTSMSFRFGVAWEVSDRLIVDPGVDSPSLEVPVEFVPGLVVGTVERGELVMAGSLVRACPIYACDDVPGGVTVELAGGGDVEQALLVWEGDDDGVAWAGEARLSTLAASDIMIRATPQTTASGGFRSVADVTAHVAGSGRYAVDVSPDAGASPGSWTLLVITRDATMPRRLIVVSSPARPVDTATPFALVIPVLGSAPPPPDVERPGSLQVQARADEPVPVSSLLVDGTAVGGDDPFGLAVDPGAPEVAPYDLRIASTADAVPLDASTAAVPFVVSTVALTLDIVS